MSQNLLFEFQPYLLEFRFTSLICSNFHTTIVSTDKKKFRLP